MNAISAPGQERRLHERLRYRPSQVPRGAAGKGKGLTNPGNQRGFVSSLCVISHWPPMPFHTSLPGVDIVVRRLRTPRRRSVSGAGHQARAGGSAGSRRRSAGPAARLARPCGGRPLRTSGPAVPGYLQPSAIRAGITSKDGRVRAPPSLKMASGPNIFSRGNKVPSNGAPLASGPGRKPGRVMSPGEARVGGLNQ
jgi:hypothetical protein